MAPELLPNQNRGPRYAERTAHGIGTAGGTPLDIRMDGPGFDAKDVPGGASVPTLQSTTFVPTAEFFRTLRTGQASLDLLEKYAVSVEDNGLEGSLARFPAVGLPGAPRRHRAFPLIELA